MRVIHTNGVINAREPILSPLTMGWCQFFPPYVTFITLVSVYFTVFFDPTAFCTRLHIFYHLEVIRRRET
jgi:hypothetical protein